MRRYVGGALALLLLLCPVLSAAQNRVQTGSITTNGQCITMPTGSTSNATLEVTGTWTGTLGFQGKIGEGEWFNISMVPIAGGDAVSSITDNGRFYYGIALSAIQACATATMTGTALVAFLTSLAAGPGFATSASAGAPADATYVVISGSAGLSDERTLTGTAAQITVTDGGAGSTVTLSVPTTFTAPGTIAATTTVTGTRLISTVATGTAPLTVASTTNVANLNASSLSGATFAAPGPIGSGTASTGAFTTMTATSLQAIIGNMTPAAGTFTALTGTSGSLTGLTALAIRDSGAAFDLTLAATGTGTSAGRVLTFDVANGARTLKLTGNPTLADWFDQSVKAAAAVTFGTLTVTTRTGTPATFACFTSAGLLVESAVACQ